MKRDSALAMAMDVHGRYTHHMDAITDHTAPQTRLFNSGFIKKHAFALVLGVLMLAALPAYLAAMEGQFIDMEFLASLCGISGWGS